MRSDAARADPSWGNEWLPLLIAAAFVAAAVLPVLFDVIRDIPPSYDCGDGPAPGHDERVAAYRSGYEALHALALLLSVSAALALSVTRKRRRGQRGIGIPTICVLGGAGAAALSALVFEPAQLVVIGALLPAIALAFVAAPLGPQLTGLVAVGLLAWAGARAAAAARIAGPLRAPAVLCWVVLVLTTGHALIVFYQGHGPLLC